MHRNIHQRFDILAVGRTYLANGGNAQGNQITIGMGGITLKLRCSLPLSLSNNKFVIGFGKVIHANIEITSPGQFLIASLSMSRRVWASGKSASLMRHAV